MKPTLLMSFVLGLASISFFATGSLGQSLDQTEKEQEKQDRSPKSEYDARKEKIARKNPLIGKLVFPKPKAQFEVGSMQVVPWNRFWFPATIVKIEGRTITVRSYSTEARIERDQIILAEDTSEFIEKYIEKNPKEPLGYVIRSMLHRANKDFSEALHDLDRADELGRVTKMTLGERYRLSLKILTEAGGRPPVDRDVFSKLAKDLLKLDPNSDQAISWQAYPSYLKGNYKAAVEKFSAAIEKAKPPVATYYTDRAFAYYFSGDSEKCKEDLEKAIEVDPKCAHSYYAYAYALTYDKDLQDLEKAEELALKACELGHWNHRLHVSMLAAVCRKNGDSEKAQKYSKKAIELVRRKFK